MEGLAEGVSVRGMAFATDRRMIHDLQGKEICSLYGHVAKSDISQLYTLLSRVFLSYYPSPFSGRTGITTVR